VLEQVFDLRESKLTREGTDVINQKLSQNEFLDYVRGEYCQLSASFVKSRASSFCSPNNSLRVPNQDLGKSGGSSNLRDSILDPSPDIHTH
jgi:hypothetical protein